MANRILAIDYGTRRVGLALSDPFSLFAQPLAYLKNRNFEDLVGGLKKIIQEREVCLVLMGLAKRKDNTLGPVAEACVALASELEKVSGVEVKFLEEAFTSRDAEEILIQDLHLSREKRKELKDSMAACLILRGYLEHKK